MNETDKKEQDRAARIAFWTGGCHETISTIYEQVVDREYDPAKNNIKALIKDLRDLYKSIEDDDF